MTADRAEAIAKHHPAAWRWLSFVAVRFPQYRPAAVNAEWVAYALEQGLDDTCKDIGHEFWCRRGEGTCRRQGALTCNDSPENR